MATATITSKGQITIPAEIRKRLKLEAGQVLRFDESEGFLKAKKVVDEKRMRSVFGRCRKRMKGITMADWLAQTRGRVDLPASENRAR